MANKSWLRFSSDWFLNLRLWLCFDFLHDFWDGLNDWLCFDFLWSLFDFFGRRCRFRLSFDFFLDWFRLHLYFFLGRSFLLNRLWLSLDLLFYWFRFGLDFLFNRRRLNFDWSWLGLNLLFDR